MEWTVEQDGEYRARFTPERRRPVQVTVDGSSKVGGRRRARPDEPCAWRRATPSTSTPRCARRCSSGSREETDGRFFRAADTADLADAISYSGKGITVVEERELWDMPVLLLVLLGADGRPSGGTAARGGWHDVAMGGVPFGREPPGYAPIVLTSVVALLAGAGLLAQRGGGFGGFGGPMELVRATLPYDGQFVFVRMSYPSDRRPTAAALVARLSGRRSAFHEDPDGGERHPGARRRKRTSSAFSDPEDVQVSGDLPV